MRSPKQQIQIQQKTASLPAEETLLSETPFAILKSPDPKAPPLPEDAKYECDKDTLLLASLPL